jgi:hypothetical protein
VKGATFPLAADQAVGNIALSPYWRAAARITRQAEKALLNPQTGYAKCQFESGR